MPAGGGRKLLTSMGQMSRLYAKGCHGKRGFSTPDKADDELRRSHKSDPGMDKYFCPWCHLWHIGHGRHRQKLTRQEIPERQQIGHVGALKFD
jgi:hypothetical protein